MVERLVDPVALSIITEDSFLREDVPFELPSDESSSCYWTRDSKTSPERSASGEPLSELSSSVAQGGGDEIRGVLGLGWPRELRGLSAVLFREFAAYLLRHVLSAVTMDFADGSPSWCGERPTPFRPP